MSEHAESLLVLKTQRPMTVEQRDSLMERLTPIAQSMGMRALVLSEGFDVGIHSDIRPLIKQQLEEQRKTNELLLMLIQAMGEEQDPEQAPSTYMDGSPVV